MSSQKHLPTPDAALVLEAALAQSNKLCDSWQSIRDSARSTGDKALELEADGRIGECREQTMKLLDLLAGINDC